MRVYHPRRVSGLLLLSAFVLILGGAVMYGVGTPRGWVGQTSTYYAWERALFMELLRCSGARYCRTGASASRSWSGDPRTAGCHHVSDGNQCRARHGGGHHQGPEPYALIVVAVLLLFGAEVLLGAAVLVSRLVPAWVGWAAVIWNLACP